MNVGVTGWPRVWATFVRVAAKRILRGSAARLIYSSNPRSDWSEANAIPSRYTGYAAFRETSR